MSCHQSSFCSHHNALKVIFKWTTAVQGFLMGIAGILGHFSGISDVTCVKICGAMGLGLGVLACKFELKPLGYIRRVPSLSSTVTGYFAKHFI